MAIPLTDSMPGRTKPLRRALLAVASSAALALGGLVAVQAPAEAALACTFDSYRIHPSGHQQRTDEIGGCSTVSARHFWCSDSFCNSGGWTNWVTHSWSALSAYKPLWTYGQGSGQIG